MYDQSLTRFCCCSRPTWAFFLVGVNSAVQKMCYLIQGFRNAFTILWHTFIDETSTLFGGVLRCTLGSEWCAFLSLCRMRCDRDDHEEVIADPILAT